MFSVLFDVDPKPEEMEAYLGYAKLLRPELEKIDGFVDNIRYGSLRHPGRLLSLSNWRDEKALIRWRTLAIHHDVQEKGRFRVFSDYHLRVGQLTGDTRLPEGHSLREQRLDETETGTATTVTMIDATRPSDSAVGPDAEAVGGWLGLRHDAEGLVAWDAYKAILTPGDLILILSWRSDAAAAMFEAAASLPDGARCRRVRVVRDYGMHDRREAPQFYPDVTPSGCPHRGAA